MVDSRRLRRRIFGQLWTLAVQFALGMVLNVIGSQATGGAHTVYVTALVLHILTAIGLVEGGVYIVVKVRSRLNWATLAALALTFISGAMTTWTSNEVWSFVMASGFLVTSWLYGVAYVRADRGLHAHA